MESTHLQAKAEIQTSAGQSRQTMLPPIYLTLGFNSVIIWRGTSVSTTLLHGGGPN